MLFEDQRLAPYHGDEPFLFLSYSHRDAEQAAEIILRFKQAGFRLWYDEGVIPATQWDENIARAIGQASYFVSLISEAYLASSNCLDELNYARDLGKPQLLIYLEDVSLPEGLAMRLGRLLAIYKERYDNPDVFYGRVFRAKGIKVCRGELPPQEDDTGVPDAAASGSGLFPGEEFPEEYDDNFDAFGGTVGAAGSSDSGIGKIIALLLAFMLMITLGLGWHYRHEIKNLLVDLRYNHSYSQQTDSQTSAVPDIVPDPVTPTPDDDTAVIIPEETPIPTAEPAPEADTDPAPEVVVETTPYPVADDIQEPDTVIIDDGSGDNPSKPESGTVETDSADSGSSEDEDETEKDDSGKKAEAPAA